MNKLRTTIAEISRLLLALTFLFSGFVKAVDPMGGAIKIGEYFGIFGLSVSFPLTVAAAMALASFEFFLGAIALMGVYKKCSSRLFLIVMVFMTSITLFLAISNPVKDCGCFGDALKLTNWQTFGKNIILLLLSLSLFFDYHRVRSLFSVSRAWFPTALSVVGILLFSIVNYRYLPMIDFRPFKVGSRLDAIVSIPPGEKADEYEFVFVYEQKGERREFTLDALPDSTWTFVERHERLVSKGYQPPVPDFSVFDPHGDDITEQILHMGGASADSSDKGLILLISPNLSQISETTFDLLNRLYTTTQSLGANFCLLSGSDTEVIDSWRNKASARYPIYIADATILKTMARDNPSILFVSQGIITGKYAYRSLPEANGLSAFVENHLQADIESIDLPKPWGRLSVLSAWVALLIFASVGRLFRRKPSKTEH